MQAFARSTLSCSCMAYTQHQWTTHPLHSHLTAWMISIWIIWKRRLLRIRTWKKFVVWQTLLPLIGPRYLYYESLWLSRWFCDNRIATLSSFAFILSGDTCKTWLNLDLHIFRHIRNLKRESSLDFVLLVVKTESTFLRIGERCRIGQRAFTSLQSEQYNWHNNIKLGVSSYHYNGWQHDRPACPLPSSW